MGPPRCVEIAVTDQHAHPRRRRRAWKHDGVRVMPADQLDPNTAQTPGMDRQAAINFARVGAQKLWAGTVHIHPNAKTGAHHHGHARERDLRRQGRARMRWGERLEFIAEAGPGDFIYVPPFVPHQEINASPTRRSSACWCAATARRSRSISTSSRSRSPRTVPGSIRPIRRRLTCRHARRTGRAPSS